MSADERLVRYLLGECSESEGQAVEDEYLSERESFDALTAVEDELVEQYVRGELSPERRTRFESHVLVSREGREKVRLARSLGRVMRRRSRVLPWRRGTSRSLVRVAALAAVLLVAAIAAWEAGVLRVGTRPGPAPTLPKPSPATSSPGTTGTALAVVDLVPGVLRAGEALPAATLASATQVLHVRAFLDPASHRYARYRVVLATSNQRGVVARSGLTAMRSDAGWLIDFECPTSDLLAGEYLLTVFGTRPDGREEPAGDYRLLLVRTSGTR